jgi:hypothetical protein
MGRIFIYSFPKGKRWIWTAYIITQPIQELIWIFIIMLSIHKVSQHSNCLNQITIL